MKLNKDKHETLASGFKYENVWVQIRETKILEQTEIIKCRNWSGLKL